MLRSLVTNQHVALCDQYSAVAPNWYNLSTSDRLHPNMDGYTVIAQTWKPVVMNPGLYHLPQQPDIVVSTGTLSFGELYVGQSATLALTVTNAGNANLYIGCTEESNPLADPFEIIQEDCSSRNIAPGASCTFTVQFKPGAARELQDAFEIQSNDADTPSLTITTLGTGKGRAMPWNLLLRNVRMI